MEENETIVSQTSKYNRLVTINNWKTFSSSSCIENFVNDIVYYVEHLFMDICPSASRMEKFEQLRFGLFIENVVMAMNAIILKFDYRDDEMSSWEFYWNNWHRNSN